ncbi:exlusion protein FxsA [Azospirillum thiophilum]|uniref:Exlusion protein FxsA n=1 Tax=Azospirillum thiophilum TaxID=528244 RepID=A0AAC8VVT8_9PROT|nr:FxsA family protein [Azospirillum thiophilum]ALG70305.1 exlusion protein FxsA [Azospirillum thiophilum]KJR66018.1 exlusion protein FxsA [Azospirillum thiophilum]
MNPLLLILLLPILEIVGFIQVGDWLGAGPTIGLLALSVVVGVLLVRHQGLASLTRAQAAAARGEAPIGTVLDGFCAVLAGILLIIPGFLTDLLGLALLIRPLRRGIGRWLLRRLGAGLPVFTAGQTGFGSGGFGGAAPGGFGADDPRHATRNTAPNTAGDPFRPPPSVIDGDYRDVTTEDGRRDAGAPTNAPADARPDTDRDAPRLTDSQWGKPRPDERR